MFVLAYHGNLNRTTSEACSTVVTVVPWAAVPLPSTRLSQLSLEFSSHVSSTTTICPSYLRMLCQNHGCENNSAWWHMMLDLVEYFCFTPFTKADISVYLPCLVLIVSFILAQRSNTSLQS